MSLLIIRFRVWPGTNYLGKEICLFLRFPRLGCLRTECNYLVYILITYLEECVFDRVIDDIHIAAVRVVEPETVAVRL